MISNVNYPAVTLFICSRGDVAQAEFGSGIATRIHAGAVGILPWSLLTQEITPVFFWSNGDKLRVLGEIFVTIGQTNIVFCIIPHIVVVVYDDCSPCRKIFSSSMVYNPTDHIIGHYVIVHNSGKWAWVRPTKDQSSASVFMGILMIIRIYGIVWNYYLAEI